MAEYLVEEVLSQLEPDIASISDRISGPGNVFAPTSSTRCWNVPIPLRCSTRSPTRATCSWFPLIREGVWYRYHQLFGDLLRARLRDRDPDRFRQLAAEGGGSAGLSR